MSLEEDLEEVDGVGEKTAEKVVEVLEERGDSEGQEFDREAFNEGMEYLRAGNPDYAQEYFEQVLDE